MNAIRIDDQKRLDSLINLLKESNLPYQDISLDGNLFFSYEDEHGNIIGAGGLELYDEDSLLRSVVVAKALHGKKFGQAIVIDLLQRAKIQSVKNVYILTETAAQFFQKLGFKSIPRDNVPARVRNSSEFTSVCPVSAACMEIKIK